MNKRRKLIAGISALSILGAGAIPVNQLVNECSQELSQKISYNNSNYVNAKTSNTTMQTTFNLNVRSGAGTKYKKIGLLKKGAKVTVVSTSNGWAKINYNGKSAYVSADYLTNVTTSDSSNTQTSTESKSMQTTENLNVRSGAGTNYSKIGLLKKGEKVTVVSTSNGWAKINYNGKSAYVSAQYLKSVATSNNDSNNNVQTDTESKNMQTTFNLNVRSGAGTNYSKIGLLKKGEKVTVVSTSNGWAKIKYGSGHGYVSMSYLTNVVNDNTNTGTNDNTNTGTNDNTNTGTNDNTNAGTNDSSTYRTIQYSALYNTLSKMENWKAVEGDEDIIGYFGHAITVSKNVNAGMSGKDLLYGIGILDTTDKPDLTELKNKELVKLLNLITNSQSTTDSILNDMNSNSKNFTKVYGDLKININYFPGAVGIDFE